MESGPLDRRIAPSRRSGRGIEADAAPGLDPVAEQRLDGGEVDRRGGQDARTRGHALGFGHGEPFVAGERGGRIELETPAADRGPGLARGIAAPGDAVGKGQGDGEANFFSPPASGRGSE